MEGELGDDERQGADPWGVLLGPERSGVMGHVLGVGKPGCGDKGLGYTQHVAPQTHGNQMKGRRDDSLGLWEEERGEERAS